MQVTSVYQGPFALGVSGDVVTVLLIGHYADTRTTNLYLGAWRCPICLFR